MIRLRVAKRGAGDGKTWHVTREGFTLPLGSFYEWCAAQRYADKLTRLADAGRIPRQREGGS